MVVFDSECYNQIGLYQSLCLKAPTNKSITMAFYISETFTEDNFKSARIKAQFTDVNNPDNKMIIDEYKEYLNVIE